jgi:thiamine biosynthesis lipoprotein
VSTDTVRLIDRSVAAWRLTAGAFDPTLLGAVRAAGYDRSFEELPDLITIELPQGGTVTNLTAGRIEVDQIRQQVRIPAGAGIDPGGIGKGLAADIVAEDLIAAGADGVLVNLGGDIRALGTPPDGAVDGRWSISIDDPFDTERELARIAFDGGAVATSSRLKRRWHARFTADDDGMFDRDPPTEVHHLLDPRTRRSTAADLASVTVCAGEGWWAEAQTKQIFVAGRDDLEAALDRTPSIVVDGDGVAHTSEALKEALR